ncbi:MAG: hypothetical protein JST23_04120 [Bacteroidetes bacterium]|nr:hypothetical protein [Bacteroidota bacterium]
MKFLFVAGVAFFIGSIILVFANYETLDVERNGIIVKMKIEDLPKSCIGAKVRYFVKYSYKGAIYDIATRGNFCETHHVGELIDMKFLEGSKTILRPDESAMMNLFSFVALGVLGIVISISQWRKMKSAK